MTATFIGMPSAPDSHTGGWRTTVTIPEDTLRWGPTFPEGAHKTLANTQMRRNLGHATRTIRSKRAQRVAEMPDWEKLRSAAEAVKFEVASRMPELLEEFERNVHATSTRPTASSRTSSSPRASTRSSRSSPWPPRKPTSTSS